MRVLRNFLTILLLVWWSLPAWGQDNTGGHSVVEGERYGVNAAHRVDLYVPASADSGPNPVLAIIGAEPGTPGGSRSDFSAAAARMADAGYAVVVASYRPLAELQSPQGAWEMRDIAGWIRASLDQLGAVQDGYMMDETNGMNVIAVGSGARHIASYIFDDSTQMGRGATGIGSAVLISPELGGAENPTVAAYHGGDDEAVAAGHPSALAATYEGPLPGLLIVSASEDADGSARAEAFAAAICAAQPVCPEAVSVPGGTAELLIGLGEAGSEISELVDTFFASGDAGQ